MADNTTNDGAFDASNDVNANNAYETDDKSSTTNDGPTNIVEEQNSPEDSSQETYNTNYEANDTLADSIGNSESALGDASLGGADQLLDNSLDTAVTEAMDSVIEQGANPEAPEDGGYGTEEEEVYVWDSSDTDMSGVS